MSDTAAEIDLGIMAGPDVEISAGNDLLPVLHCLAVGNADKCRAEVASSRLVQS